MNNIRYIIEEKIEKKTDNTKIEKKKKKRANGWKKKLQKKYKYNNKKN